MASGKGKGKKTQTKGGQLGRKVARAKIGGGNPPSRSGKRNSGSSARVTGGSVHPYTKLVLDPCEGRLTSAPLPGRLGAQAIRLPIRAVITVPTATTTLNGGSASGNTVCTSFVATLAPHAMSPNGPAAVTVQGLPSESAQTLINAQAGNSSSAQVVNYMFVAPSGLTSLVNISSDLRPVAGCLKLGYIGAQGNNSGNYIAYEGSALQLYNHYAAGGSNAYAPDLAQPIGLQVPLGTLALDAWTTCDTTRSVEARVNIPAADAYWQSFRNTSMTVPTQGSAYVKGTGVLDSISLADPDITSLPLASVAVSGAVPGSQYLLTGAVVYEWVPAVTLGMPAPQRTIRDPKILQTVVSQLGKYGRMLVGSFVENGGSPPGLMIDLAMKAFSSMMVGKVSTRQPLRIGM